MTRDSAHEIAVMAATLQAAFAAGHELGSEGASRLSNPFVGYDLDVSMAWDEGWRAGAAEREEDEDG